MKDKTKSSRVRKALRKVLSVTMDSFLKPEMLRSLKDHDYDLWVDIKTAYEYIGRAHAHLCEKDSLAKSGNGIFKPVHYPHRVVEALQSVSHSLKFEYGAKDYPDIWDTADDLYRFGAKTKAPRIAIERDLLEKEGEHVFSYGNFRIRLDACIQALANRRQGKIIRSYREKLEKGRAILKEMRVGV